MITKVRKGSISFPFSKIGLSKHLGRKTSQYIQIYTSEKV